MGLDLRDSGASRKTGLDMAEACRGLSLLETMNKLRDMLEPAVNRYKEIVADAPAEHHELAFSMLIHEESLPDFVNLELAGTSASSLDGIADQVEHKLPAP